MRGLRTAGDRRWNRLERGQEGGQASFLLKRRNAETRNARNPLGVPADLQSAVKKCSTY